MTKEILEHHQHFVGVLPSHANRPLVILAIALGQHEQQFEQQLDSYKKNLKELRALVNTAVEKCIINAGSLSSELENINSQLRQNPLYEIIRLGKPSQKYLSAHQTMPPQLAVYQKLQKELAYYL